MRNKPVTTELHRLGADAYATHPIPSTLDEWTQRRAFLRDALWERLGTRPDHALDLDVQVLGETVRETYRIQNVIYQSRLGFYVTASLYLPDGDGPFPGVLNVHGHDVSGKFGERIQTRCHALAKRGYVALMVDAFGAGERGTVHGECEYHGGHIGMSLYDVGETLTGMQIVDNMRGVDLLRSLPVVDSDRIAVTGASGGGNQTMWVAAMDDRLAAALPVVSVGTYEQFVISCNCVCETLPGVMEVAEIRDILGLIAPRPLKICSNLQDGECFHPDQMLRSFENAQKIYGLYGKKDHISHGIFDLPHGYFPEIRNTMYGFFDFWLKGEGDGSPIDEPEVNLCSQEELRCFEWGKRDPRVMSIGEFCQAKTLDYRSAPDDASVDARRDALKRLLRFSDASEPGFGIETLVGDEGTRLVLTGSDGLELPIDHRKGKDGSPVWITLHLGGKGSAMSMPQIKEALARDESVIAVDLWACGETYWDDWGRARHHDVSRGYLYLGKTLAGIWVQNLRVILNYASQWGIESCRIISFRDAAVIAFLHHALFPDVKVQHDTINSPITLINGGTKWEDAVSAGIHIPGILQWGDIDTMVALSSVTPEWMDPTNLDGRVIADADMTAFRGRCQPFD